jgi:hypothetical protein
MSKPRPLNASGPNGLRGGKKTYIPKTIVGRWQEEFGGPAGYKRGFTSPEFQTECQHQQLGANFRPPRIYGPELPNEYDEPLPRTPFQYVTKAKENEPSPWLSNTQLMGLSIIKSDTVYSIFFICDFL